MKANLDRCDGQQIHCRDDASQQILVFVQTKINIIRQNGRR